MTTTSRDWLPPTRGEHVKKPGSSISNHIQGEKNRK